MRFESHESCEEENNELDERLRESALSQYKSYFEQKNEIEQNLSLELGTSNVRTNEGVYKDITFTGVSRSIADFKAYEPVESLVQVRCDPNNIEMSDDENQEDEEMLGPADLDQ